jgi:hypothetical protein
MEYSEDSIDPRKPVMEADRERVQARLRELATSIKYVLDGTPKCSPFTL